MASTATVMQGIQKAFGTCAVISRKTVCPARNRAAFAIKTGRLFLNGKQVARETTAIHSENAVRNRGMSCTMTFPSTFLSFSLTWFRCIPPALP